MPTISAPVNADCEVAACAHSFRDTLGEQRKRSALDTTASTATGLMLDGLACFAMAGCDELLELGSRDVDFDWWLAA